MPPAWVLVRVTAMPFAALEHVADPAPTAAIDDWLAADRALSRDADEIGDALFRLAGPADGASGRRGERTALLALRRDVHVRRATAAGVAALAAALPAELRSRIEAQAAGVRATAERYARAGAEIDAALRAARAALQAQAAQPAFAEGLWLASRSLSDKVQRLAARGELDRAESRFALGKVLAYLVRFTTKPSPNGVFCGTALGEFGPHAGIAGTPELSRVEIRLGVGEARKVAACLAVDPAIEALVTPRPNPTLRRHGESWTYWKCATARAADDDEVLSRVRHSEALEAFLAVAADESDIPALLDQVSARIGGAVERPALRAFFDQLVRAGILLAEVEIPWSEPRPLAELARRCREAGLAPPWRSEVERVEATLDHATALSPSERMAALAPVAGAIESLHHTRALAADELLRVDAASGIRLTLPDEVRTELTAVVESYARLYATLYPPTSFRAQYVRRFLARYPADTDVAALDLYHGVFDADSFERAADFPEPRGANPAPLAAYARMRESFVHLARTTKDAEVRLAPGHLDELAGPAGTPPFSCGVLFQVDAPDFAALAAGRWRACLNAIYPGGGLAFSRFARLLGHEHAENPIETELRAGHDWLAHGGAQPAEISYMHGGRTANAGLRPALLPLEIELPGDRATSGHRAIPLSDLVVRYDSAGERFRLRSLQLGAEVLPLVSSGISPEGFVAFLIEVGRQDTQPLAFFRGFDDPGVRDWPRFTLGRIVLFRQRWIVAAAELDALAAPRASDGARMLAAARLRERRGLPRHAFAHTDREPRPRYVDLASPLHVAALARDVASPARGAGPARLHLTEMLPGPDGLWMRGAGGGHVSEFLMHVRGPRPGQA